MVTGVSFVCYASQGKSLTRTPTSFVFNYFEHAVSKYSLLLFINVGIIIKHCVCISTDNTNNRNDFRQITIEILQ